MTVALVIAGLIAVSVLARIYQRRRDRNSLRVRNADTWDLIKSYEPSARERRL